MRRRSFRAGDREGRCGEPVCVDASSRGCPSHPNAVAQLFGRAAACGSFNAAYQAAEPGDIVRLVTGAFIRVSEAAAKAERGPRTWSLQPAFGRDGRREGVRSNAARLFDDQDLTSRVHRQVAPSDKLVDIDHGTTHLTLDASDSGRSDGQRQPGAGRLGISGRRTDYVAVRSSDICCIPGRQARSRSRPTPRRSRTRHLTLSGTSIHDVWQTDSRSTWNASGWKGSATSSSSGNHFSGLRTERDPRQRRRRWHLANWTIVNNVFEDADAGVAGVHRTSTAAPITHAKSIGLSPTTTSREGSPSPPAAAA